MQAVLALSDSYSLASVILAWIGQALLYGTVLAAVTWLLIRLVARRALPAFHAALWTIVILKFLIPVGPSWSFSLASACRLMSARSPAGDVEPVPLAVITAADVAAAPAPLDVASTGSRHSDHAAAHRRLRGWTIPLALAYVVSVLVILAVRLRSYRALLAKCRRLPPADEQTRHLVAAVCKRLGMRKTPSIRITDDDQAPFVMGSISPLLVLSRSQFVRPDDLDAVIAHEVAHLRRGDLFVRHLQWIAGSLLFFWPVVAWVNRSIDVAREHACDQWALGYGKLAPGDYARCLLRATQPARSGWFAYRPAGMSITHTTIERRIDMILKSSNRSPSRPLWGILAAAALLVWGALALTGAVDAAPRQVADATDWPATEEAVRDHATQLYNLVAQREDADLNGDGELAYWEKCTYLTALAIQSPKEFLEEFPYADRTRDDVLDLWEAHDAIRGITLIAYADRRPTAAPGARLDLEFYHLSLDAQKWLLDTVTAKPSAADLANARAIVSMSHGPRSGHVRMLNHGGPDRPRKQGSCPPDEGDRFKELEGKIASIEAQLATTTAPAEVARLEAMLDKLEVVLAKLQTS